MCLGPLISQNFKFINISFKFRTKITWHVLRNHIEIIQVLFSCIFISQQAAADLSLVSSFDSSASFRFSFDSFPTVPAFSPVTSFLNWASFSLERNEWLRWRFSHWRFKICTWSIYQFGNNPKSNPSDGTILAVNVLLWFPCVVLLLLKTFPLDQI